MGDVLADAARGGGPGFGFRIVALATLYTNYEHLVTLQSTGIADIQGIRGRVVSLGSPGSGTEVSAERVLHAAGIDPSRDVTRQALGVSEWVRALKDGKIHAFFWMGGVPTPALLDLAHTQGLTMRIMAQRRKLRRRCDPCTATSTSPVQCRPGSSAVSMRRCPLWAS